jgi:8-amino-7-oxononanoate synthase
MSMPMPLDWIEDELGCLRQSRLLRELRVRESPHVAGLVQFEGQALADFGSNDYLGIAADPRMVDAVTRATGEHGWGSCASPLVSGYGVLHRRLEEELARFEGVEACALFPSGFAANLAAVSSLCEAGDVVYSDELNHASLIDGCRLSRATTVVYRHSDLEHLGKQLAGRSGFRRALIVTDGLFSMDGDFAQLPGLVKLARQHDCMLLVDEAHATGLWGATGRGSAEYFEVEQGVDVRVGTLSKALGGIGGFIAGNRSLIDWVRNRGRSYMFSTALPEAAAAAGWAALEIVRNEPSRRDRMRSVIARLKQGLAAAGIDAPVESQIVPLIVGSEAATLGASAALRDQGLFVPAIRPPAVPPGQCRLRISLSATHSDEQVDRLVRALAQCGLP